MATPEDFDRLTRGSRVRESLPSGLTVVAVLVALLLLAPLVWVVLEAASVDGARAVDILTNPDTLEVVVNSLILAGAVTAGSILLGVPLAVLTAQTDLPLRRVWTVLIALPLVVPSYIGAFAFVSAFGPRGVLQGILAPLGIAELPAIYGLLGTAVVLTLFSYPYVFLTTRAALLSVDGSVLEAARTLNHDRLAAFRRVILPQIKPGVAAGALLVALYTLSDFGTPRIMQYRVFTTMIYQETTAFNVGFAALLSLVLLGLTVLVLAWESRINASREGAHVGGGGPRPGRISLGAWRWPCLAGLAAVVGLALAVPLGILVMWLFRPAPGAGGMAFDLAFAWNSLWVAGAAALASILLGLPIAYLSARSNSRLGSLPERATYVGYAMPGVVLGLALVVIGLRFAGPLYGSLALLVFAYVVRFIPQAVGVVESSILGVDPKHVEAARSMGDTSLLSFVRVTLPQIAPGVAAGGALVFLTTMKELPATLILRPVGFETLVTYIWQVQDAAAYGRAAVPALLLVAVSALSLLVILGRERYNGTE
jgi:iron(III) transport system permease protein